MPALRTGAALRVPSPVPTHPWPAVQRGRGPHGGHGDSKHMWPSGHGDGAEPTEMPSRRSPGDLPSLCPAALLPLKPGTCHYRAGPGTPLFPCVLWVHIDAVPLGWAQPAHPSSGRRGSSLGPPPRSQVTASSPCPHSAPLPSPRASHPHVFTLDFSACVCSCKMLIVALCACIFNLCR